MMFLPSATKPAEALVFVFFFCVEELKFVRTCIGLRCKDGVVLGVEKILHSKLLTKGANRRIGTVDRHVGFVSGNNKKNKRIKE